MFVGELTVEKVDKVPASEFSKYSLMVIEVPDAPFPKGDEAYWTVAFKELDGDIRTSGVKEMQQH